jgi:hypothetical protein
MVIMMLPLIVGAVWAATLLSGAALTVDVPAGTPVEIRLKSKVSTQTAKPKDPIEATVIAPVVVNGEFAIPAGALVRGVVEKASQSTQPDERSVLVLAFDQLEISGTKLKIASQLAAIDNSRESLGDQGQVNGILASETISGQLDTQLEKLGTKYSGLAEVLGAVKGAILKPAENDITYDAGVEMELKLAAPLKLKQGVSPEPAGQPQPIPNEAALADLVAREPFQTLAKSPPRPSDITNLLLIGRQEAIERAFREAGWSLAAGLNAQAKFETFRALAEGRGYTEAPVSVLLLDGKPPDLVFEKLNNTFARRHHLRVWKRPVKFQGMPVWAVAATHDIGISFSQQDYTFIHRIDSQIDRERAKVVNDLIFTGRTQGVALVDRPEVPQHGQNATGDNLDTDGKTAVLVLK